MYNFEKSEPRENTNAEKYTLREKMFGTEDVIPLWVADMDIDTPVFVLDALKKRLEHPILGYEEIPTSAFQAQLNWMKDKHNVEFKLEDMIYSHSVVASINVAIEAFTSEGDNIIVQTPVYQPFFKSVEKHKRVVLENKLIQDEDGIYRFDINDLKSKINSKTKLLLLCSPHNPVGRVWRKDELNEILNLCVENNIIIFSDEIHCDLIYGTNKHISFSSLSQKAKDITVTAIGVGKSFNLAGIAMSSVAIPNKRLRDKFLEVHSKIHFADGASLSHVAFESAYKNGKQWIDEVTDHLYKNYKMLKKICDKYPKLIKITPIEGTYLAWINCKGMKLNDEQLNSFFIKDAKLGLHKGIRFGENASGFMRLNFAVSTTAMIEALNRLDTALEKLSIENT